MIRLADFGERCRFLAHSLLSAAARRSQAGETMDPLAPDGHPFTWKHAQTVADSLLLERDFVVAPWYNLLRRGRWSSPGSCRGS